MRRKAWFFPRFLSQLKTRKNLVLKTGFENQEKDQVVYKGFQRLLFMPRIPKAFVHAQNQENRISESVKNQKPVLKTRSRKKPELSQLKTRLKTIEKTNWF